MNPAVALPLGFLLCSFFITGTFIIPFINLLYKLKFQRVSQHTVDPLGKATPIFDKFNQHKAGTPVGGGLLIIFLVSILFFLLFPLLKLVGFDVTSNYESVTSEVFIIFFTFISFGLLGLYDDIKKFFNFKKSGFFGLRMPVKLLLQVILATIISVLIYHRLGIQILNIPFFGTFDLGIFFIPFSVFAIVSFTNAVNITDGMDGLAGGALLFALLGLWFIAFSVINTTLSLFMSLWLGSLIAFLYFNVYPARIWMGDAGALSFGATLAVVGILLGKTIALVVIGMIFVVEIASSLFQLLSKKLRGKKLYLVSPFHLYLRAKFNWEEPKIVSRLWLAQIIFTLFGIWLTLI